ncbi:hypothetical protein ACRE_073820 [Hapsidospora chrysogenum ATCC 11550]|uniref:Uncharacterized protein n=1 Tax=Hapsidospora chrysogenum (strain ATCC 11550 / CBS 779.69 / DSM 880 / IAM 14645 / JCM 23072 / IMI 49137) TaxID=857340 RepID=A0A086SXQ8_HAPC1|nr:hypothetical protein ACRE_073820 [Hapsidospora chrysogenum ATCC 11550]
MSLPECAIDVTVNKLPVDVATSHGRPSGYGYQISLDFSHRQYASIYKETLKKGQQDGTSYGIGFTGTGTCEDGTRSVIDCTGSATRVILTCFSDSSPFPTEVEQDYLQFSNETEADKWTSLTKLWRKTATSHDGRRDWVPWMEAEEFAMALGMPYEEVKKAWLVPSAAILRAMLATTT